MEKTELDLILENQTYRDLKDFLATVVLANLDEKSFYTYFCQFLMDCEEKGNVAVLRDFVSMAEKHCDNPLKTIVWLSNVQHFMFPKDVETASIS